MASLGDDLLVTVNKLQDLVFNTIGNDSLDLPQIVSRAVRFREKAWEKGLPWETQHAKDRFFSFKQLLILTCSSGRCRFAILWEVLRPREHRWP